MKMNIEEFVKRQAEYEGHKIKVTTEWKDGSVKKFERLVNDSFCEPSGDYFKITEIEILEYIGIATIKVKTTGRMEVRIAK